MSSQTPDQPHAAKRAAYGSWNSPISVDTILHEGIGIDDIVIDPVTHSIYYLEKRPFEGGRLALVALSTGKDVLEPKWDLHSTVHEYGGASTVIHNGVVYFTNVSDSRVYQFSEKSGYVPITPESKVDRFADLTIHPIHTSIIVAIHEDHTDDTPSAVKNSLAVIDANTKSVHTLVKGADFYSTPRFSPDGSHLAWKEWYHPDMPWMGSRVMIARCQRVSDTQSAELPALHVDEVIHVAGQRRQISVGEINWLDAETLVYTSDETGYSNPYTYSLATRTNKLIPPAPIKEDFAEPAWFLGWSASARLNEHQFIFSSFREGCTQLYLADLTTGEFKELNTPYVYAQFFRGVSPNKIVFFAKTAVDSGSLVELTISHPDLEPHYRVLKSGSDGNANGPTVTPAFISVAEPFELKDPSTGQPIHGIFYAPTNPEYDGGLPAELPPVILSIHGGPTWKSDVGLDLQKQYFTSRGFAWIDCNHGGSSGYGRAYIERLVGQWGIVDVNDSIQCIKQLGSKHKLDVKRAAIRGGSAGGYTTLQALTSVPNAFAAGNSFYGVSEIIRLRPLAHKFESYLMDNYYGSTPEEDRERWEQRSPLYQADKITAPLLILQGTEDPIVPPSQSKDIVETVRKNGGIVEYREFEGEGHGWRKESTIRDALEMELSFYRRIFVA